MNKLSKGKFYGRQKKELLLPGVVINETQYSTSDSFPWHYHENPYFALIRKGSSVEKNRKATNYCTPGTLLFHNSEDPHCNPKYNQPTMVFHLEMDSSWLLKYDIKLSPIQGNFSLDDAGYRTTMINIWKEFTSYDSFSKMSIDGFLLQMASAMLRQTTTKETSKTPRWVNYLKEILHTDDIENISLKQVAHELSIHPVHISREFPKYFNSSSFGEYVRKIKIEKAISLLSKKELSLTDIAYTAGFSDQSHFTKTFKSHTGILPSQYRKFYCNG